MNKKCYVCEITKPLTEFNKNNSRIDNVQTKCKLCEQQHYLDNKVVITKVCIKCKVDKSPSDFYKGVRYKDGLFSRCKQCMKAQQVGRKPVYRGSTATPDDINYLFANMDFKDSLFDLIEFVKPKHKVCRACKVDKLEYEFYKANSNEDGRTMMCKKCTQLERKQNESTS